MPRRRRNNLFAIHRRQKAIGRRHGFRNWRTPRRRLVLTAIALFIAAGLFTVFVMGPVQAAVVGAGYSDAVDEALRVQAARWHMLDWTSWALTLSVGVVLATSLAVRVPEATATSDAA